MCHCGYIKPYIPEWESVIIANVLYKINFYLKLVDISTNLYLCDMNHKVNHPVPPSLVAQIGALYHRIYKECDRIFRENGLPLQMDQIPVLMSLYYSGGASQNTIGIALARDKASVNRTISVLLKKGLVKVIPDTFDKRKTCVELTASGQQLAKHTDTILGRFDATLSAELTAGERTEFDKAILKLIGIVTPC